MRPSLSRSTVAQYQTLYIRFLYTQPGKRKTDRAAARIGRGVLLAAGATVLGNVDIGDFAKIGAGTLVLASVPSGYTAVGVPARLVGHAPDARPALDLDQSLPT